MRLDRYGFDRLTKECPFGSVLLIFHDASEEHGNILALFDLIPVPPLDGGRMLSGLFGPMQTLTYRRMEPCGVILLVVLIFTGMAGRVIWPVISMVEALLL